MDANVTCSLKTEPLRLGDRVLLPSMGRHVETVLDRSTTQLEQVVAECVACGASRLGDREGDQPPLAIPPTARRVLRVREAGAFERRAERTHALRTGVEDGVAPFADASEQILGHQPAKA